MKRLLFIMNPVSGQLKGSKNLASIISVFNEAGYEVTTYMTAGPGDGEIIARRRAGAHDLIVCAGGDGTLNEVINGLLKGGIDIPIGYIPVGSTNDFAASLGLSSNPVQAAKDIMLGKPETYDVGLFGDRYFSYVASFGAFTRSSYATPQNVKNALGHLAYVLESITELPQIRPIHARFELPDEVMQEDDYIFGAVSNSTSIGGLMTLDPSQVDMRDGKLELLLVRSPRDMNELAELIGSLNAPKTDSRIMAFRSVPELTIHTDPNMLWTLDGERREGSAEIHISNIHNAIRLIRKCEEPHA